MDSLKDYFDTNRLPVQEEIEKLRRENMDLRIKLLLSANADKYMDKSLATDFRRLKNENHLLRQEAENNLELLKTVSFEIDGHERAQKEYVIQHQSKIAYLEDVIRRYEENNTNEKWNVYKNIKNSEKYKEMNDLLEQKIQKIMQLKAQLANREFSMQVNVKKLELLGYQNDSLIDKINKYDEYSTLTKEIIDKNEAKLAEYKHEIKRLKQLNKRKNDVSMSKLMSAYLNSLRSINECPSQHVLNSRSDSFIATSNCNSIKPIDDSPKESNQLN